MGDGGARRRRSPQRRWGRWLGFTLIAVGLALLGYAGWELWGTTWLSHRTQERIVDDVEQKWRTGDTTRVEGREVVIVPEGEVSALLRIPRFGDDYVIPVLEGTSDGVLAAGYGHFDGTADPGETGNFAVAAHRVTHGEPLRDMPELEIGDEVIVETSIATYTYELISGGDDLRVSFHDGWVVEPVPDNPEPGGVEPAQVEGQRLITLTTCAEIFHTDYRLVAFGVLDSTVRH